VDTISHAIRTVVETLLGVLDPLPPAISLAVIAAATAPVMLVAARYTSPQRLIARARAQVAAAIYEMRLYLDSPRRVLRAQGRMFAWTGVYLACLVPTMVVLGPPLGLVYLHLDARHGLAPLPAPSTVVVRIELAGGVAPGTVDVVATGAARLTAPLVHAPDEPAVYARVAIDAPGTHHVTARVAGAEVAKRLDADPDAAVVSPARVGGVAHLWADTVEPPPETDAVRAITVRHPERVDPGLPVPWWLYWLGLATILALGLRRRFDVEL
jgi:hypothetical protein